MFFVLLKMLRNKSHSEALIFNTALNFGDKNIGIVTYKMEAEITESL